MEQSDLIEELTDRILALEMVLKVIIALHPNRAGLRDELQSLSWGVAAEVRDVSFERDSDPEVVNHHVSKMQSSLRPYLQLLE